MTTIRVARRQRYTVIARPSVNDDRLSFRALGLLVWLLDKPDDWRFDATTIARDRKEGRTAILAALKELRDYAYLRREQHRDTAGKWRTETLLYEMPESSQVGFPDSGSPDPGEPDALLKPETKPQDLTAEQAPPSRANGSRRTRARTERDAYFTALESAFGPASTGSRGSFYGKAVTQVMAAGGKPEDIIRARVAMSRRGWEHPTPEAMLKHWDDLLADAQPRARPLDHYEAIAARDMASRRGA